MRAGLAARAPRNVATAPILSDREAEQKLRRIKRNPGQCMHLGFYSDCLLQTVHTLPRELSLTRTYLKIV